MNMTDLGTKPSHFKITIANLKRQNTDNNSRKRKIKYKTKSDALKHIKQAQMPEFHPIMLSCKASK